MARGKTKEEAKREAEADALRIARRLAKLQPEGLSEAEWTDRASVSRSFFSNLRGRPSAGPSNPSAYQLHQVLDAIGVTRAEFFAEEAAGRVALVPTKRVLEDAIAVALPGRPRQEDRLPEYLAETVLDLLSLHPEHLQRMIEESRNVPEGVSPPRAATKKA